MKQLYQAAFKQVLEQTVDPVRADEQRAALASRCSPTDLEVRPVTRRKKTIRTLLVAAAVLAALTAGALAATGVFDVPFLLGGGVTSTDNRDGTSSTTVTFTGDCPLEVRDGALYLSIDGQELDLTGLFSEEEAYVYTSRDAEGNTHEIVVGGTVEDYGWFEFLFDPSGNNVASAGTMPMSYDLEHAPAWLTAYRDSRNLIQ